MRGDDARRDRIGRAFSREGESRECKRMKSGRSDLGNEVETLEGR